MTQREKREKTRSSPNREAPHQEAVEVFLDTCAGYASGRVRNATTAAFVSRNRQHQVLRLHLQDVSNRLIIYLSHNHMYLHVIPYLLLNQSSGCIEISLSTDDEELSVDKDLGTLQFTTLYIFEAGSDVLAVDIHRDVASAGLRCSRSGWHVFVDNDPCSVGSHL